MQRFYISDLHLGHEAVIRMCDRPFPSIDEMDRMLIENWNSVVQLNDEVYIIGDFMFKSRHDPVYYLKQLRGKKHLILGNHEKWTNHVNLPDYFETVSQYKEITDSNRHLILFHYPLAEWARYHQGSMHVFGHIHNNRNYPAFEFYRSQPNMLNAGVDINHFIPVSLNQLIANNEAFRNQ